MRSQVKTQMGFFLWILALSTSLLNAQSKIYAGEFIESGVNLTPKYYCLKTQTPPVIDGELGEWGNAMVMSLNRPEQLIYGMVGSEPWGGPEDLGVFAYLMWDEKNLYLAIDLSDDFHSQDHNDGSIYAGDSIQLAFDSLNDGVQPAYDTNDNEYGLALGPSGPLAWCWVSATGNAGRDARVKLAVKKRDDGKGYIYESVFPWESISPLYPDTRKNCGFSFLVNDNDGNGRAGWLEWTSGIGQGKDPTKFGDLIFVERLPDGAKRKWLIQSCLYQDKETYDIGEKPCFFLSVNNVQEMKDVTIDIELKRGERVEKIEQSNLSLQRGFNYKKFYINSEVLEDGTYDLIVILSKSTGEAISQTHAQFSIIESMRLLKEFDRVEESYQGLVKLLNDAKEKGIDIAYPQISTNVIAYFLKWGRWDIQEKELERAKRVVEYIQQLAQETVRETGYLIANPESVLSVPVILPLQNLKVHNGAIYAKDRPVFLFGAVGLNPDIEEMYKYVFNLHYTENALWADYPTPEKCTGADTSGRLLEEYHRAEKNNIAVCIQLASHYTPGWIYEKYPDTRLTGWSAFMGLSIDSSNTRKVLAEWYKTVVPMLSNKPALLSYEMENEINYMDKGELSKASFRQWLENQYKDIDGLNRIWGAGYKDFSEVAIPEQKVNPASWYDWLTFNQHRLTEYFAWVKENIRKYDPVTPVQVKHIAEAVFEEGENLWGVDREGLAEICEISSFDMATIGPLVQAMTLDYLKSLAPYKPLFNSECYYVRGPYTSADKTKALIWQGALHGQCTTTFWHWGHTAKDLDHVNLFCFQPWAMNAMGRTFLDLNRLSEYVVEFPREKAEVAILFSMPSKFLSSKEHLAEIKRVYEGLFYLGNKIDFVTEKQIQQGKADNYKFIIAPQALHVKDETYQKMAEYVMKGGILFIIGNSFAFDEHGRSREDIGLLKVKGEDYGDGKVYRQVTSLEPGIYARRFNELLNEIGIERRIHVVDMDIQIPWEVEARTVKYKGNVLMYLINWGREPRNIQLKADSIIKEVRNLMDGKKITDKFSLAPLEVVLLSINL